METDPPATEASPPADAVPSAAETPVLQPKDYHAPLIDVVVLGTQSLADGPQGDAVRHRGVELEDPLHTGQRLVRS